MRFDDRISTVLALGDTHRSMRVAKWRQLVDLLAQRGSQLEGEAREDAFEYLRRNRAAVDPDTRRDIAVSLAGRAVDRDLLAFFAGDAARIASPLIAAAQLPPNDWLLLLPRLTPTARALLRHRRDLGPEVTRALASFGSADFVVAGASVAAGEVPEGLASGAQIRELVERIEAFRRHQGGDGPFKTTASAHCESFRWEAGTDGLLNWIDGAPRGALIGLSIGQIADHGQFGVDGQASGAFEKRSSFRNARLSVAGIGIAAGDWRISGVPYFDPATGSFHGYRGSARRPRMDEIARAASQSIEPLFGPTIPADSLRQLVHEMRTPLNAIIGFAEMMAGQYVGPVADPYQSRAEGIVAQAGALLTAVDDLDTAARFESIPTTGSDRPLDVAALVDRVHAAYRQAAAQRGAVLIVEVADEIPAITVDERAAERLFARMIAAAIGLARSGETIRAVVAPAPFGPAGRLALIIDRPAVIEGLTEAALLDPGYSPQADWPDAPILGLGFSLRLIRNLAESVGGTLHVDAESFRLLLPAAQLSELTHHNG